MAKVIFNGLGPSNTFHHEGTKFVDGDSPDLPVDVAVVAVQSGYAIPYTDTSKELVDKKIVNDDKKRTDIAKKVSDLKEGGK